MVVAARSIVQETFWLSVLATAPVPMTKRTSAGSNLRAVEGERVIMHCLQVVVLYRYPALEVRQRPRYTFVDFFVRSDRHFQPNEAQYCTFYLLRLA